MRPSNGPRAAIADRVPIRATRADQARAIAHAGALVAVEMLEPEVVCVIGSAERESDDVPDARRLAYDRLTAPPTVEPIARH